MWQTLYKVNHIYIWKTFSSRLFLTFGYFFILCFGSCFLSEKYEFHRDSVNWTISENVSSGVSEKIEIPSVMAHAPSLAVLPDGRICAVWFGGSREGGKDVKIYGAIRQNGQWSQAVSIIDREHASCMLGRYIRKLGNPVLHYQDGCLHLYFVTVSFGGWSGSTISHVCLQDDLSPIPSTVGRLRLSPLFNLSHLVRCPANEISENRVGLPIYHECIKKYGLYVILSSSGHVKGISKIPAMEESLQPCLAILGNRSAVAGMRNAKHGKIMVARTDNAGFTWEKYMPLPIKNPDSSIAMLCLPDRKYLLVGNSEKGRSQLNMWLSEPNDLTRWRVVCSLENTSGADEYSYPFLQKDQKGNIHLIYTWNRRKIAYRQFAYDVVSGTFFKP